MKIAEVERPSKGGGNQMRFPEFTKALFATADTGRAIIVPDDVRAGLFVSADISARYSSLCRRHQRKFHIRAVGKVWMVWTEHVTHEPETA